MDKASFGGVTTLLQYFGFLPKKTSVEEAANQLVQELTETPSAYAVNSPAFSAQGPVSDSNAALAALRIMYGEEPEDDHDQASVFKGKIKDARENYLENAGNEDRAKLVADFDEKVTTLLAQKLKENIRPFYCEKEKKLKQSFQNGISTRDQCNQEMVYFLKEISSQEGFSLECEEDLTSFIENIKNQRSHSLEKEVMSALSLIGDEKGNVTDGLFYLFGGNIQGNFKKRMLFFDQVLESILDNKKFASPEENSKVQYKRNFIAKARENLATCLPEPDKTEFFKFEKEERDKFISGNKSYDGYADSVRIWLMNRPLECELEKALQAKSGGEVCTLLSNVFNQGDRYNSRVHKVYSSPYSFGFASPPNVNEFMKYNNFLACAYRYVDSKPSVLESNEEKYKIFMTSAKKRLIEALPRNIREAHEQHLKVIGELLQKKYIYESGHDASRNAYLLVLAANANHEEIPGSGAAINYSRKSDSNSSNLREIVSNSLPESIALEGSKEDTLKALLLCWGATSYRGIGEKFGNFGKAQSNYLKTENLDHVSDPDLLFRPDSEFLIEARAQLVDKLSPQLREAYNAREKLLLEHLEKSHITHETYWSGMALFLREHQS